MLFIPHYFIKKDIFFNFSLIHSCIKTKRYLYEILFLFVENTDLNIASIRNTLGLPKFEFNPVNYARNIYVPLYEIIRWDSDRNVRNNFTVDRLLSFKEYSHCPLVLWKPCIHKILRRITFFFPDLDNVNLINFVSFFFLYYYILYFSYSLHVINAK